MLQVLNEHKMVDYYLLSNHITSTLSYFLIQTKKWIIVDVVFIDQLIWDFNLNFQRWTGRKVLIEPINRKLSDLNS